MFLAVRALERRVALRYRSSIILRRGSSTLIGIAETTAIVISVGEENEDTNTNTNTNQSTDPVSPTSAVSRLRALLLKLSRRVHSFKQRIWMTITSCRLSLLEDRVDVTLTRAQMLKSRARTRKVLVQTVLYIAVFIITSIWPIIITVGFISHGVNPPVAL